MRLKTSRALLDRSCAWIREHWNAQNTEVPDEYLEQWLYVTNENQEDTVGFQFTVFTFGYFQHDLVRSNVPPGVKRSVHMDQMLEYFHIWQLKLALAQVHRCIDLKGSPIPLFSFRDGERLEFWQEDE